MKSKIFFHSRHLLVPLLLLITIFITGCNAKTTDCKADQAFENFTMNLFCQEVSSSTIGLHYTLQNPENYGITDCSITYGFAQTDNTASLAAVENCIAVLKSFPYKRLSPKNQLTYDVLASYLNTAKNGAAYTLYEEPLSPITGVHAQLPVLLAEYQFHTSEDVETYLKLLETTPDYFNSLIAYEQEKLRNGLFMADSTVDNVLEQCEAFLDMGNNNYLFSTFEERISALRSISTTKKEEWCTRNTELVNNFVYTSYKNLKDALTSLKGSGRNTQGLCYLPKGREYYSYLVTRDTGSSRSVEDMELLIQSQIASDFLSIQKMFSDSPEASKAAETSFSMSPESIIEELEKKTRLNFPQPATVNTQIKYIPTALEQYLSPAFYMIPAIDNSSENVIYIKQAHNMEKLQLFTTLAHEGYPGHLYQTTYYASTNPDPIRTLLDFGGYIEGWATYAEMCSYSLSPLEKSYAELLQKNNSIILGLYAASDIGIHFNGWSVDDTIQFFNHYGIEDRDTIKEIYELIISDPANYLKYYVGYVEFLELKKEAIEKEGKNFSQKEFHKTILEIGPAPFDILRKWYFK